MKALRRKFCLFLILLSIFSGKLLFPQEIIFDHISSEGSPTLGTINSIIQDQQGFLWLGTSTGLFRYDGYVFKAFKHDPTDSSSISGNYIWSICEDSFGDLWIGTSGRGLNKYLRQEDRFIRYQHDPSDTTSLAGDFEVPWVFEDRDSTIWVALWEKGLDRYDRKKDQFIHRTIKSVDQHGIPRGSVHRIYEDGFGDLWIGTKRGVFRRKCGKRNLISYRHDPSNPKSIIGDYIYAILEDREGNLWFAAHGSGLSRYVRQLDEFVNYGYDPDDPNTLSSALVTAMCVDSSGYLWAGTDDNGLNRLDPLTGRIEQLTANPINSLRSNRIASLYVDKSGAIWVGTVGTGLNRYDPNKRKFNHHHIKSINQQDISIDIVDALFEADNGNVWVGTTGGLYQYDLANRKYIHYKHDPNNKASLTSNFISALHTDESGNLWVGTSGGGLNYLNLKTGFLKHYRNQPQNPGSLASDLITCLLIDHNGNLWIGTDGQAVSVYQKKTDTFNNYGLNPNSALYDLRHVFAIFEDSQEYIWIGTWGAGVVQFNPGSNSIIHYQNDPDDSSTMSGNNVISIAEDSNGLLWFGTWGEGINCLDRTTGEITRYSSANGLPNDNVYGILCDNHGNVWISTSNGLAKFDATNRTWKSYTMHDGIQSPEFRQGSYHKGKSGRFYFGGINGFNEFFPTDIKDNPRVPPIVLTSFKILDHEVLPCQFNSTNSEIPELKLSHHQNYFSLEFAALDFTNPPKNQYAYKLEGLDEKWIYGGNRRYASYTNLDPGDYVLRVKGSNNDGIWNEQGVAVNITIEPPPWKTWWAYSLYIASALAFLYGVRRYELNRLQLKNQLKLEHMEAEKLKDLDQMKSRFFANLSHEFRTPLTLILGPLENAISKISNKTIKRQLRTAFENGRRLLHLINQILDLSKLETGGMELRASKSDLIAFLKGVLFSFESAAQEKEITLRFQTDYKHLHIDFDREKLEQVFYNLIANAIKFTPSNSQGKISIRIVKTQVSFLKKVPPNTESVQITVKDTGIGIPEERLEKIFDRFYQVNDSLQGEPEALEESEPHGHVGTGIGLALAKEMVELHRGQIVVNSQVGKGAEFIVTLPIRQNQLKDSEIVEGPAMEKPEKHPAFGEITEDALFDEEATDVDGAGGQQDMILVVEDNSEVRTFIRQNLEPTYKVIEAENGDLGLKKSIEVIPDLIISDVMMPGMDGYELCHALKNEETTSHIPVILLTAKAGQESKLTGLRTGADDYLTKPFRSKELLVRVKNLIEQRSKLRVRFSREVILKPGEIAITSMDEHFLSRVMGVIEKHIGDEDFSVEDLGRQAGMSRVQLHRKLRALTNQSASQFILFMRLHRAIELIEQEAGTVSEIAYRVGFNTPNYFAKCFRKQFGCSPSEYKIKSAKSKSES